MCEVCGGKVSRTTPDSLARVTDTRHYVSSDCPVSAEQDFHESLMENVKYYCPNISVVIHADSEAVPVEPAGAPSRKASFHLACLMM